MYNFSSTSRMKKKRINKDKDDAEDWCFICKDGGDLRLCDYEGCTKVYHPKCVNRKNSFLKSDKKWICDHHSCSVCRTTATIGFSCLLCPYSACDNFCINISNSEFVVVRGKEESGLCEDCLELVRLAEDNADCDRDGDKLDFEDLDTFECGFKECWEILKENEGLTLDDFYSPEKETEGESENTEPQKSTLGKRKAAAEFEGVSVDMLKMKSHMENGICEDDEDEITLKELLVRKHKKRKSVSSDHVTSSDLEEKEVITPNSPRNTEENGISEDDEDEITLKELPARKHKKRKSVSSYDVTSSDSEEKEPHLEIGISEDDEDEITVKDRAARKHKKRKLARSDHVTSSDSEEKTSEGKEEVRSTSEESCFASIVASNMKLVYLRRSLVEELMLKQLDNWERKVVGSFVRVKNDPKDYFQGNSSHQLTQVKGIIRKQDSDEILLHLPTRNVPISLLSDCDFTEEECGDFRERVENYVVRRPTVVEIEHKARELHEDLIKDWIEREFTRLQNCIRHEENQAGWISRDLCKYLELRELLKQTLERKRLSQQEQQVIAEVLDASKL